MTRNQIDKHSMKTNTIEEKRNKKRKKMPQKTKHENKSLNDMNEV